MIASSDESTSAARCPQGPGLLTVGLAGLAVGAGEPAVAPRALAVAGGALAIACGTAPAGETPRYELGSLGIALRGDRIAVVELAGPLVGDLRRAITPGCHAVALLGRAVASTGRSVPRVGGRLRIGGIDSAGGRHAGLPGRERSVQFGRVSVAGTRCP
jgi:hypothetical protein